MIVEEPIQWLGWAALLGPSSLCACSERRSVVSHVKGSIGHAYDVVTSLLELVTTLTAARLGAYDLAAGNLFGSNLFNMFILGLTDVFFTQGRFLAAVHPAFALAGMLALLLTGLGLIGNLARLERRVLFVELDALLLVLVYLGGLWLLYSRGIGI